VSAAVRRQRRSGLVLAAAVVVLAAGVGGLWWVLTARDRGNADTPTRTTATARTGTLTRAVDADFALARATTTNLTAPAAGVVTGLHVQAGQKLASLAPVVDLDGTTIWGLGTSTPFYRNLTEGDEGADVEALEHVLAGAGYDPGDADDGVFDADTAAAIDDWQAAKGLTETGRFDLASFVRFTRSESVLEVKVAVGDKVSPGTVIASAGVLGDMVAKAEVNQLDVGEVKAGQRAELTLDGETGTTVAATVTSVASDSSSSGSASAGTTQVVQYEVDLDPARLPAGTRPGMTGQASIVVQARRNVVIVPTAAVQGGTTNPTVQVVQGDQVVTRPVVPGLATGDETEILTGLRAGEEVVTGSVESERQLQQQQQQQQQQQGPGPGGFPGGGFGRRQGSGGGQAGGGGRG
jgi:multidrug efflux pump subunit AcrA (membrane-fusion protein)